MIEALILIGGTLRVVDRRIYDYLGLGSFEGPSEFFGIFDIDPPFPTIFGGIAILIAIIVFVGTY